MTTSPYQCLPFPLPLWCAGFLGAGFGAVVRLVVVGAAPQRSSVTVAPTRTRPVGRTAATVPAVWPPGLCTVVTLVFSPSAASAAATSATGLPTYAAWSTRTVAGFVAEGVGLPVVGPGPAVPPVPSRIS